jgi:riboflavin synthase
MFTGLVEDTGVLRAVSPQGDGLRLTFQTRLPLAEVALGDSIACDGACLTVVGTSGDTFDVVAGAETLRLTTWGGARPGRRVHFERALALGARLGGHLVQGHIDGVGTVTASNAASESWVVWIDVGAALARYVIVKGSITLDGVSLTINEVVGTTLRVNLIPHTAGATHLVDKRPGEGVNVETDLIARYVERLLGGFTPSEGVTLQQLQRTGFLE